MTSNEIRKRFLDFFEKRGHKVVSSASLVPENDPSVLFTTAGMQQFKPYYVGAKDPMADFGSKNTVSVQKCVRTSDIDEVGDNTHLTFFEMLGNFSFGGYWKKEAINYAHKFITKELGLKIDYVSVFEDSESGIPADTESEKIWKDIDSSIVVKKHKKEDNFWGPTGEEGPCGPTTEIYINGVEIWNIVFNEFYKTKDDKYEPLKVKGIDTGMGLERLLVQVQNKKNVFETDLFESLISILPTASVDKKQKRIIVDHAKASSILISDGVRPSNKDRGYILRRLIRRMIVQTHLQTSGSFSGLDTLSMGVVEDTKKVFIEINNLYSKFYPELNLELVNEVFYNEFKQFNITFKQGLREIKSIPSITASIGFNLYSTFGITYEIIKDVAPEKALNLTREDFDKEFEKHQEISRAGAEQKFKGGLAGTGEMETKYHTAIHLLHQALRDVLGNSVSQKGSNITSERLRFDFTFDRKMTEEEKRKVEDIVNEKIKENLPMKKVVMKKIEAEKTGALHFFGDKYGDEVNVYYIGDSLENAYSKEFCGGPHVENTGVLGHFKIGKEEAISAGVRRIKATLE